MNPGVTIFLRADNDVAAANDFLESLVKHNSYKPVEVLLWAKDTQQALVISRNYLAKVFIRVLPATTTLGRIIEQSRYENFLIVDLPMQIKADCLAKWLGEQKTDQAKALLCSKKKAQKFSGLAITTAMFNLAETASIKETDFADYSTVEVKSTKKNPTVLKANLNPKAVSKKDFSGQKLTSNEFARRYGWLQHLTPAKNILPLENNSDNFSNKEVHRCDLFSPYQPTKKKSDSLFKILSLVSDRIQECLSYDAEMIPLDLNKWESQLTPSLSFVLIESDSKALQLEGNASFNEFMSACNKRGIPTVFWHTDAREHCSMYLDIAKMVGYVGAVEQESVAYYAKHTKASVRLLEHAIQPALHNAIREELPKPLYSNMRFFFDGWADLIEFRDKYAAFLQPLSELGLHIFESKWQFMKNKLPETPQFIKNIHGVINYRERLNAIKHFDVYIMAMPSMKSTSALILDALEAIASKRLVLFKGNFEFPMLSCLIHQCESNEDFIVEAKRLVDYPAYRDECAHKAWRFVHTNHTFVNRLNALAEWLDLPVSIKQFPSVASVTVTKRPELLINNAKKNYLRQNVPNKEWIIILNTLDVSIEKIEASLKDVPNVRIYHISSDNNIGFCLNVAIRKCQSDYWAKMDDDDYYGTHYLHDYMLNINACDLDVIGKKPSFVYLESENAVYVRNTRKNNFSVSDFVSNMPDPHMCGATFCAKRVVGMNHCFSETIRSAVDSTWYKDCVLSGLKIVISDSYNMTIFRAADKSKHTWRLDDEDLKKNALFVTNGITDSIMNI